MPIVVRLDWAFSPLAFGDANPRVLPWAGMRTGFGPVAECGRPRPQRRRHLQAGRFVQTPLALPAFLRPRRAHSAKHMLAPPVEFGHFGSARQKSVLRWFRSLCLGVSVVPDLASWPLRCSCIRITIARNPRAPRRFWSAEFIPLRLLLVPRCQLGSITCPVRGMMRTEVRAPFGSGFAALCHPWLNSVFRLKTPFSRQ